MSHACFLPVASAILDWGMSEGATNFSHVFQPLGAIGVRHGCTGQLHNQLFTFGSDGKPEYKFKAGELLRGETDGSSYPNGGLRSKSMQRARARARMLPCLHCSETGGVVGVAWDGMQAKGSGNGTRRVRRGMWRSGRRCGDRVLTWCCDVASSHPLGWRVHDPGSHLAHLAPRRHHLCPDVSVVRVCAWARVCECALARGGAGRGWLR